MAKLRESTVLVVVDMQPGFTQKQNIIDNVAHLVKGAKRDKVPVIFLELNPRAFKETHLELTEIVAEYKKHKVATKWGNDGSRQVQEFCRRLRLKPKHFVMCGVYFGACVHDTTMGLRAKYQNARFSVVKEATDHTKHHYSVHRYNVKDRTKLISLGEKG